ncbi:hypothetical protein glysoja_017422 [Glycine soja]|nr:hypothetical protein glysoja_017422 [Glycine soja]
MQRGDGNREGRVRVAMSALVSLDVYLAMVGEEEHVSLLQMKIMEYSFQRKSNNEKLKRGTHVVEGEEYDCVAK